MIVSVRQARGVAKDSERRENAVTYQHILYEVSDKIATITLHRPERMNAWTPIMERDVRHAMETAAGDDDVRVIVLTGSGRAFCAGADMDALKGLDPDDIKRATSLPPFEMNRRPDWQARYAYYPSIPKPVIGMLNGATAGIGLVADMVSPSAMAVIKRQLYDVPFQTLAEATIDANREMVVALRGSDFREGVASFMEKRPPRFTGE
jgi:enoyl-CoA hydratase/carnithine racemase